MNEKTIYDFYSYFYRKISRQQDYLPRLRKQEKTCIENFFKKVDGVFGQDSLFDYLCFAFSKYEGLETNQGKNNIPIMWVLGQKTFKEYQERDHERSAYWVGIMKRDYQIKKSDLIEEKTSKVNIKELDRRERKRFARDIDRQLVHCIENFLYDENCTDCIVCIKKSICHKIK